MRTVDLEVAEELRDEPELLAIADALAATHRRLPRRQLTFASALLVALAASAVAVLALRLGGESPLVERALAAVGPGPIVHAVLASDVTPAVGGAERIDLRSGNRVPLIQAAEVWYDERTQTMRTVMRLNGQRFETVLSQPGQAFTSTGPVEPEQAVGDPLFDVFLRDYRQALEGGRAVEVGSGTINGQDVTWLQFPTRFRGMSTRVAVTEDGTPVAEQVVRNGRPDGPLVRVLAIRSLSAAPDMDAPVRVTEPVTMDETSKEPATIERAERELNTPLAWPGESVGGVQLEHVSIEELTFRYSDGTTRSSKAVVLEYANEAGDFLRILQSPNQDSLRWRGVTPPAGTADIYEATARMRVNQLYATIEASSRDLALAAARRLARA